MKTIYFLALSLCLLMTSCLSDAVDEIDQNASVKNLIVNFKSFNIDSLVTPDIEFKDDKSKYHLYLSLKLDIENTKSSTAKSQGIATSMVVNQIEDEAISLPLEPFTIEGNSKQVETALSDINFETHSQAVKYILEQAVNESLIESSIAFSLLFEQIGSSEQRQLALPAVSPSIATKGKVPQKTLTAFQVILNSKILD